MMMIHDAFPLSKTFQDLTGFNLPVLLKPLILSYFAVTSTDNNNHKYPKPLYHRGPDGNAINEIQDFITRELIQTSEAHLELVDFASSRFLAAGFLDIIGEHILLYFICLFVCLFVVCNDFDDTLIHWLNC